MNGHHRTRKLISKLLTTNMPVPRTAASKTSKILSRLSIIHSSWPTPPISIFHFHFHLWRERGRAVPNGEIRHTVPSHLAVTAPLLPTNQPSFPRHSLEDPMENFIHGRRRRHPSCFQMQSWVGTDDPNGAFSFHASGWLAAPASAMFDSIVKLDQIHVINVLFWDASNIAKNFSHNCSSLEFSDR